MALLEPFVYYGTSEFSRQILVGLLAVDLRPSLVVTTEPKPSGRGLKLVPTPVSLAALEAGITSVEVSKLKPLPAVLAQNRSSWALLAAFGKLMPREVLELYSKGIINVHPSLLPQYRGASPIQAALYDGKTETGVSLMLLDEELDHGPILAQSRMSISPEHDALSLALGLADAAVKLLPSVIRDYLSGALIPKPQDHTQATLCKRISRLDGQANFELSAEKLNNLRRAYAPWPGLFTTWKGKTLKLLKTSVAAAEPGAVGTVSYQDGALQVICQQGWLCIHELKLAGADKLSASDFVRGHKDIIGAVLPS